MRRLRSLQSGESAVSPRFAGGAIPLLAGLGLLGVVFLLLPPIADHFGYARPFPHALPPHFTLNGLPWHQNSGCFGPVVHGRCTWTRALPSPFPSCPTRSYLQRYRLWPLVQTGSIPTLLGRSHPVYILDQPSSVRPPLGLALVKDGSCYIPYEFGK